MANSDVPSAGTARPDAAPSDSYVIEKAFDIAARHCYASDLPLVASAHAQVAALRRSLAERDAECERLREQCDAWRDLAKHLQWCEECSMVARTSGFCRTAHRLRSIATQLSEPAAVAPAAREETRDV